MPKVIYASGYNSDMFYANQIRISDPYFYLDLDGKKHVFLDHREIGVFKEKNKNDNISSILLNPIIEEATLLSDDTRLANRLALVIFRTYGLDKKSVEVPNHFPLDMADFLRSQGCTLKVRHPFFPERAIKQPEEIEYIRYSLLRTHKAFQHIEKILEEATIDGEHVSYRGNILTSEFLKAEVHRVLLDEDMFNSVGLIIASGEHAAVPHHEGHGPIWANEPLICDIFPVHRGSGYFADMTRTYVKGTPSKEMQKIYDTVKESQEAGIATIKPGVQGTEVHKSCSQVFLDAGYEVGDKGFIHGTGHGLGLDVHEPPLLSARYTDTLELGNVVTVEPGLYYSTVGSARIEDVVVVTENGCENLTNYPKKLVIS